MSTPKSFSFDMRMYVVSAIFFITGFIIHSGMPDLVWIYWGAYALAILSALIFALQPQEIEVSSGSIRSVYISGKANELLRDDIMNFSRKHISHKTDETEWLFSLRNGHQVRISNSMRTDAAGMREAVNEFCIGLDQKHRT